jgi:hypothetical protein
MGLIRVFKMPSEFPREYCFGGGHSTAFQLVDWFRDFDNMMDGETGRSEIAEFIKGKRYFKSEDAYLVLHERHSFTIGYSAP